jgi:hypothetical protein
LPQLRNDDTGLLHDADPDDAIARRFGTWLSGEIAQALDRTVIKPYSAPFYEGRTIAVGAGGTPTALLAYHAGRVRALVACSTGTALIGSLSQLAGGNGYTLSTSPVELKVTDEVYVLASGGAASVSVWAEYAVQ